MKRQLRILNEIGDEQSREQTAHFRFLILYLFLHNLQRRLLRAFDILPYSNPRVGSSWHYENLDSPNGMAALRRGKSKCKFHPPARDKAEPARGRGEWSERSCAERQLGRIREETCLHGIDARAHKIKGA